MAAGRGGIAKEHIVELYEILRLNEIMAENISLSAIIINNQLDLIKWLARHRLLGNSFNCQQCLSPMSFFQRAQLNDGFRWQCRQCQKTLSIRHTSFFARSRLTLQQILIIIYCWCRDFSEVNTAHEAGISENSHTIVDWANFCREVCEISLENNPQEVGGLNDDFTSKVVEIDESKFFHRKYHRGQWREGHWVFGGCERGTGKCFLIEVPNRTAETLIPIIQRFILPGTIIMSDAWRAYQGIQNIDGGVYEHRVIVHQQNFLDPNDRDVHTQSVENMWMRAKRKLRRQFGTSEEKTFSLLLFWH